MVIAQLIDGDGIHRGIHNFLVQLRSMEDHTLLPGVKTGDIGPKIGYNTMDNGFAYFKNVMIPRRNMAMRFASVDKNGRYSKKVMSDAASKVAYITVCLKCALCIVLIINYINVSCNSLTLSPPPPPGQKTNKMMQVRSIIVVGASKALAMACAVTIRYSAVRKQGFDEDGKSEMQVLDYTQQQHRIFPLLAASYCIFFTGRQLAKDLKALEEKLIAAKPVTKEEVSDVHAASSALKSFSTMIAADGIEECRKACGGHGFLSSSGLPELFTTYLQSPTVEGDNHMLPQQVIRVLLKLVHAVQHDDGMEKYKSSNSFALVPSLKMILRGKAEQCSAINANDLCDLSTLLAAFRHRCARLLVVVAKQINDDITTNNVSPKVAWNNALVTMAKSSKAFSLFLLIRNSIEGIRDEQRKGIIGRPEAQVLSDLTKLFALYWMEKDLGDFLEDGYIRPNQAKWVAPSVLKYLAVIRKNAVALVDAPDFSDFRLKSALGRYDGNVYPHIMKAAEKDPLNAVDPGPAYEPELKRLITGGAGIYTASRL